MECRANGAAGLPALKDRLKEVVVRSPEWTWEMTSKKKSVKDRKLDHFQNHVALKPVVLLEIFGFTTRVSVLMFDWS